ncbi:MerR family transcriptional regulator [Massilia sp. DWR3-1-1]|uniref:MerR family transcriptional regulator n=1 Tax=Massilia sp. DWR3-1-1 TaxID=2804559 RepID=UPI003CEB6ECB
MENNNDTRAQPAAPSGYRSGVAARLAGLGAATLRVWERRYQLTAAPRSASGQRLYTSAQVDRLRLLKQLVDQGHPIGILAPLPMARLQAMAGSGQPAADAGAIDVAAIGAGLLRRLAAAIEDGLPLRLRSVHDAAVAASGPVAGEPVAPLVLLVELAEPDGAALAGLMAARQRSGAAAVVVLYRFCASATVRLLRAEGFMVARFPGEMGELPLLCQAALQRRQAPQRAAADAAAAPRFDDVTLAAISATGSVLAGTGGAGDAAATVRRDCARALAEMLLTVGSFERYSAACVENVAASAAADAALHRDLEAVAGHARTLLEQAMGRLLRAGS